MWWFYRSARLSCSNNDWKHYQGRLTWYRIETKTCISAISFLTPHILYAYHFPPPYCLYPTELPNLNEIESVFRQLHAFAPFYHGNNHNRNRNLQPGNPPKHSKERVKPFEYVNLVFYSSSFFHRFFYFFFKKNMYFLQLIFVGSVYSRIHEVYPLKENASFIMSETEDVIHVTCSSFRCLFVCFFFIFLHMLYIYKFYKTK